MAITTVLTSPVRRAGFPSVRLHTATPRRFPIRPKDIVIPPTGRTRNAIWTTPATPASGLPSLKALETLSYWTKKESHAVANTRGALMAMTVKTYRRIGMTVITHAVTTTRTQGLSAVTLESGSRPGITLLKIGLIRANMSG